MRWPAPVTLSEVPHRSSAAISHSWHLDLLSVGLNRVHLKQPRDERAARPNSPGAAYCPTVPNEKGRPESRLLACAAHDPTLRRGCGSGSACSTE